MGYKDKRSKPKLVILEGPDKVGKSTIFQAYRRATKYIPLVIDRFIGSNYVYDILYERNTDKEIYLTKEIELQELFDCYLVSLTTPSHILVNRIKAFERGKDKDIALSNIELALTLFLDYHHIYTEFEKKILIDTYAFTEKEVLDQILKFTKEV